MKVCDLTQFYSPVSGGVKRYVQEKRDYVRRRRPGDCHVLIVPGADHACHEEEGGRTYTIRSPLVSKTSRYRALLNLGAVEAILHRERPDLLESGDPYQVAWKAVASARFLGIPATGFYHSHFPEAYLRTIGKFFGPVAVDITRDVATRYVRALYSKFDATLVPSPALARLLESWGLGNVHCIELGVRTEVFHPRGPEGEREEVRRELGVPAGAVLLLYVGRLSPEKNTDTLFDAFALLAGRAAGSYHLVVAGDGPQRRRLQDLQGRCEGVHWLQYQREPEALARLYRAADIFVHPGVQETFGLVALESQACGTPVVGIRGSYMDRIIFNDQRHWAAESTPSALAAAVEAVAASGPRRLGAEAGARVGEAYSWDRVFDRLFAVYTSLVNARA